MPYKISDFQAKLGLQTSTGKLVQTTGSNAVVLVYIPDPSLLPVHINMAQFVLILERPVSPVSPVSRRETGETGDLFSLLKPTISRAFVASPGYSNPDMDNTKHIEKIGKKLHIYWLHNGTYYHLHTLTNLSALSHLMNKGRKWAETIIDRDGFYHHQLLPVTPYKIFDFQAKLGVTSKTILDNTAPLTCI